MSQAIVQPYIFVCTYAIRCDIVFSVALFFFVKSYWAYAGCYAGKSMK